MIKIQKYMCLNKDEVFFFLFQPLHFRCCSMDFLLFMCAVCVACLKIDIFLLHFNQNEKTGGQRHSLAIHPE